MAETAPEHGGPTSELVFLTNVGDNATASLLRAYLGEHGIHCYIQGENHRGLLGVVGTYIDLRIMVPASDLETAETLLAEYDNFEVQDVADPRGLYRDEGDDEDEEKNEEGELPALPAHEKRLLSFAGLAFPFGGAHFRAGAPITGLLLAAVSAAALLTAFTTPVWALLWPVCVILDLKYAPPVAQRRHARRRLAEKASAPPDGPPRP